MNKKGQAAMEFLMTYGWAILVVLAAIGALAYFGVLSPGNLLPDKCTMNPGFDFGNCKASVTSGLQVSFLNGLSIDAKNVTVEINSTGGSDVSCSGSWDVGTLANGALTSTNAFCTTQFAAASEGQKFGATVKISFIKSGESLSHSISGTVQLKVEE